MRTPTPMKNSPATSRLADLRERGDDGIALLTVILLLAALTAVTSSLAVIGVNNLQNANRDRQSGAAFGTADAGIAQAIQYIRTSGINNLQCAEASYNAVPATAGCAAKPFSSTAPNDGWANPTAPHQVVLDGTGGTACNNTRNCYKVWISYVKKFAGCKLVGGTQVCEGTYRIHSKGFFGNGPSSRRIVVDVTIAPFRFPIGVYGYSFTGGGNTGLHTTSLYTSTNVCNRGKDSGGGSGLYFQGYDDVYQQPASAHAEGVIGTSGSCGSAGSSIHSGLLNKCAADQLNDQDSQGIDPLAPVYVGPCNKNPDGTYYSLASKMSQGDLAKIYGLTPKGLTQQQYAQLKTQAMAECLYFPASTKRSNCDGTTTYQAAWAATPFTQPVLYFDGWNPDMHVNVDVPSAFKFSSPTDTNCDPHQAIVIVRNSAMSYQGGNNNYFPLAMFVPEGNFNGSGGENTIGTLFAQNIAVNGNTDFYMDKCFADNPPGGLLDVKATAFHEEDGTDVTP